MTDQLLVCRGCRIPATLAIQDDVPVKAECPTCRAHVDGQDAVRKMIEDEARRLAYGEAQTMIERAFRNARGIRLERGDPPPEPAWPFVYEE